MQPGEQVVSAIQFEGEVLIFGSCGSVLKMTRDGVTGEIQFHPCYELPIRR